MRTYFFLLLLLSLLFVGCGSDGGDSGYNSSSQDMIENSSGISGSKTKFKMVGDYLYTVNEDVITIIDIADASTPIAITRNKIFYEIDTISSYENYLYIGVDSEIYIYDKTDPTQLKEISSLSDIESCDPIAVENGIAYVTHNVDSSCGYSDKSQLEIFDIRDIESPKVIKTVPMWAPSGIAIDNSKLFICDGDAGLKVYDVNSSENNGTIEIDIINIQNIDDAVCNDIIAHQNNLILTNSSKITQYDYSSFPMIKMGSIQ